MCSFKGLYKTEMMKGLLPALRAISSRHETNDYNLANEEVLRRCERMVFCVTASMTFIK